MNFEEVRSRLVRSNMSFTLPAVPKRERLIGSLMNRDFPGVGWKERTYAASFLRIKTEPCPDQLVLDACQYRETLESLAEDELEARLKADSKPADKEQQLFLNRAESMADQGTWDYWVQMATWTSPQATALSLDRKPERVTLQIAVKFQKQSAFARSFIARHNLIHNAIISGTLLVTPTVAKSGTYPTLIAPKNFALWVKDRGLDVPGAIKGLVEDRSEPQAFKEIINLNWEDITLTLLRGDDLEASAGGLTRRVPLSELNLISRRGTKKTNERFALLTTWAQGGQVSAQTIKSIRDHAYKLRRSLQTYFGITTNPLPTVRGIYTPRFRLLDKRDAGDKRAKESAERKTVSFDESNLAHQGSLTTGPASTSEETTRTKADEYPIDESNLANDPAAEFLSNKRRD